MALSLFLETHRRWRRRLALSPERHLLVPFRRIVPSAGGLVVSPASSSSTTPLLLLLLSSVLVFLVLGDDRIGSIRSIRSVRRRRRRRVRAKIVSNRFVRRGSPTRVAQRGGVDVVLSRRHEMRSVSLCSSTTSSALLYLLEKTEKKMGEKWREKLLC